MKVIYRMVLLAVFGLPYHASTQDVGAFWNKENYRISGFINSGGNYYGHSGTGDARYAPLGYFINGGIQARLGAITVPISFSFNQLQGSISSPFNMYGASPYYKWIKLHLGVRSLSFSPYTMNGRSFKGIGLELTPGQWNFTAFRGKMKNYLAYQDTIVGGALALPTYRRNIIGGKVGYGNRNNGIELTALKISDDPSADVSGAVYDPVENLVAGMGFRLRLFKRIRIESDVSGSLFTSNREGGIPAELSELEEQVGNAFTVNTTTRASWAAHAKVAYHFKGNELGVQYRRVDPFYTSLATNYLQNDIESVTLTGGLRIAPWNLRLRGSVGLQKDNLKNHKSYTSNRVIGSMSATYLHPEGQQLMLRYSNYQHESNSGLQLVNDTFRIVTVTHNAAVSAFSRLWENEIHKLSLSLNAFSNILIDENPFRSDFSGFKGIGTTANISYQFVPWKLTFSPFLNITSYHFAQYSEARLGGGMRINKTFFDDKMNTGISSSYQQNQYDGLNNGHLVTLSGQLTYKPYRSHQLSLRQSYIHNKRIIQGTTKELRLNLTYGYRF